MKNMSVIRVLKIKPQTGGPVRVKDHRTTPSISVSDTIFDDGILCLIDGKKKRNLRKWLILQYGMTPSEYRRQYKLPDDYPMTVEASHPTPGSKVVTFSKPKVIASPQIA